MMNERSRQSHQNHTKVDLSQDVLADSGELAEKSIAATTSSIFASLMPLSKNFTSLVMMGAVDIMSQDHRLRGRDLLSVKKGAI